jgi:hypothetical protein
MASGHCLCGQVGFETRGDPRWVSYCHCASCRRHAGSPVTCFVNFPRDRVVFRGERTTHRSSPGVTRSHCARCGTPIAYETVKRPDEIDLYLGAFDAPEAFEPQGHAFFEEHIPWFDTKDELPRK